MTTLNTPPRSADRPASVAPTSQVDLHCEGGTLASMAVMNAGTLVLGSGTTPASVRLVRIQLDLRFKLTPTRSVTVRNWFKGPSHRPQRISFSDGSAWRPTDIDTMDIGVLGTPASESVYGNAGDNLILAGAGNDLVYDNQGHNVMHGGDGNDFLIGQGAMNGDAGNDILIAAGDARHNVYHYDVGGGNDILYARSDVSNGRAQGTVAFGDGLDPSRLWFRRHGSDLDINVVGTLGGITIRNWYLDAACQVAGFKAGNGRLLARDKVEALVQVMAGFTLPVSAHTVPGEAARQALATAIAANWM